MADLNPEEIRKGRKMVGGPKIVFWICIIAFSLGSLAAVLIFFTGAINYFTEAGGILNLFGTIGIVVWGIIWIVLLGIELRAIGRRKYYAIGLGRMLLIVIMIFTFPIGSVMGAVVWRRFSHPTTQEYLNHL